MIDQVAKAKSYANKLRFAEELNGKEGDASLYSGAFLHRDAMYRQGLAISSAVLPSIEAVFCSVCESLHLPRQVVSAFVYSSPDIQADCITDGPESCVIRLTSGLVNLLGIDDLKFVVGHEIGHYLLGHGSCSDIEQENSTEGHICQRARELSADRIGYYACGGLEPSVKAIMKTVSGLNSQYLRFDVSEFLRQATMLSAPSVGEHAKSSHPSMIIRARALSWLSMSGAGLDYPECVSPSDVDIVDKHVARDLKRFVDGTAKEHKSDMLKDLLMWKVANLIYATGSFSQKHQHEFGKMFGHDALRSMMNFFGSYGSDELEQLIGQKGRAISELLIAEFPLSAHSEISSTNTKANSMIG